MILFAKTKQYDKDQKDPNFAPLSTRPAYLFVYIPIGAPPKPDFTFCIEISSVVAKEPNYHANDDGRLRSAISKPITNKQKKETNWQLQSRWAVLPVKNFSSRLANWARVFAVFTLIRVQTGGGGAPSRSGVAVEYFGFFWNGIFFRHFQSLLHRTAGWWTPRERVCRVKLRWKSSCKRYIYHSICPHTHTQSEIWQSDLERWREGENRAKISTFFCSIWARGTIFNLFRPVVVRRHALLMNLGEISKKSWSLAAQQRTCFN